MKIVSIVGARPQFVKEAVVQRAIKRHSKRIEEVLVHTGQHYDQNMSDAIFDSLKIEAPQYNLDINGRSHGEMTGQMLIELEKIFIHERPDCVIVYGDTNSTLAGALAASKLNIPIAHIEAGLRQEPKSMPEEKNRVLTDHLSSFLYAPSRTAVENLEREGIKNGVLFCGDVMYDVFLRTKDHFSYRAYERLALTPESYALLTLHRDFNVDDQTTLSGIVDGLNQLARELPIIFPVHPRTISRLKQFGMENSLHHNIVQIEPLPYLELMGLTQHCSFVLTDSGGFQKESYFSGKPGLVLMPDTAWRELVDNGVNKLVDGSSLYETYKQLNISSLPKGIYGQGNAAELLVDDLICALEP